MYDPQNPDANRDPRFDATIIHEGSTHHGELHENWIASDANIRGFDFYKQSGDNPCSNYILKKFMFDESVPLSWQERILQFKIIA